MKFVPISFLLLFVVWGSLIKYFMMIICLLLSCQLLANERFVIAGRYKEAYVKDHVVLSRPPGVFLKIFSWYSENGGNERCLFFKTPLKKESGQLVIYATKNCKLDNSKKVKVLATGVDEVTFSFDDYDVRLKTKKSSYFFSFPFQKRFSYITRVKPPEKTLRDGVYCRRDEKDCADKVLDRCNLCQTPFITTSLNRFCANRTQRRCGAVSCGRKNEIACLKILSSKKKILTCAEAKEHVFCQKGRLPYCEPSGRIICK